MSKTDKGGPAFPQHPDMASRLGCMPCESDAGITARDYFAAKAMQGMFACPVQPQSGADMYARDAYFVADAMLKERELKERDL